MTACGVGSTRRLAGLRVALAVLVLAAGCADARAPSSGCATDRATTDAAVEGPARSSPPADPVHAYRRLRNREARLLAEGRPQEALALYADGPLRARLRATVAAATIAGARVAGGPAPVPDTAIDVLAAGPRRATLHVREVGAPWTVVAGDAAPPPRVLDDHVLMVRRAHRWRVAARQPATWVPEHVQRRGEHWPAVSFDGRVPPPPLRLSGSPDAAVRSIVAYLDWLHAHRPDPALLDAVASEHGPARDVLAAPLERLRAGGLRLDRALEVQAVAVRGRGPGWIDVAVTLHRDRAALVDRAGRAVAHEPAWTGALSVPLVTDQLGRWRVADVFPSDLAAWPEVLNPLRIP